MSSEMVIKTVWADYCATKSLQVAAGPSNKAPRPANVPNAKAVPTSVQTFVRERRSKRQRTVARDVMSFLRSLDVIRYGDSCTTSVNAASRGVQRFLDRHGYRRGKKASSAIRLSTTNAVARAQYVTTATARLKGALVPRTMVYTGESYVHHNYKVGHDTLFDPNDLLDMQNKEKHKGRRLCFIAAIIDKGLTASEDVFEGDKQTKDYHGMFNGAYYGSWLAGLLECLEAREIRNACIVLDNAKYHKSLPPGTPRKGWKKSLLVDACRGLGIDCDETDLKAVLWGKLEAHVSATLPVVVTMAREKGHEVLFTPPSHSRLQPIEIVREALDEGFEALTARAIYGCIKNSEDELKSLYLYLIDHEELSGSSDESAEDDDDDSGSSSDMSSGCEL
ncbi:hypothetical protein ACHHYP_20757 [Achlya hypogyna]|uniref:Tc1-like transposase DDE domain-containing protein n=1 Tax=Achlya hypogyna TaxID=1202772 RepID=A0A1V9YBX5_ACHHY|nr:hypothetical protein ACHHYP_20757 [Achlya hypogyna]